MRNDLKIIDGATIYEIVARDKNALERLLILLLHFSLLFYIIALGGPNEHKKTT